MQFCDISVKSGVVLGTLYPSAKVKASKQFHQILLFYFNFSKLVNKCWIYTEAQLKIDGFKEQMDLQRKQFDRNFHFVFNVQNIHLSIYESLDNNIGKSNIFRINWIYQFSSR